jgi:hypothetical protein
VVVLKGDYLKKFYQGGDQPEHNGRYKIIVLRTNGRWSVDIVLSKRWRKLFSGMQALPENRGACVDTRFGPMANQKHNSAFGVTDENR